MKDRVHKKHTTKFTTTSNKILQDGRLTYEAIGVFMYLWSMPDDWQIMVRQVMKHNNSTEYKVRQALRELRNYGYMKWKRLQGYCEYDMCEDGSYHCGDIQHDDTQHDDTQHDNIYIQNNNINKTITETNTASGFSQNENPVVNDSLITQNPTVKESLTVQKPKKEIDFPQEFIEFYEAYEGKHPLKQPKTAEKAFSKWKNACKTHTNDEILRSVQEYAEYMKVATWRKKKGIIEWLNGGLYETDWIQEKLQEQSKQQKPTFNNQYAQSKLSMSESADLMRQMAQYTKEQQEQLNQKEYEYPF
jgi:hypothetical protein